MVESVTNQELAETRVYVQQGRAGGVVDSSLISKHFTAVRPRSGYSAGRLDGKENEPDAFLFTNANAALVAELINDAELAKIRA